MCPGSAALLDCTLACPVCGESFRHTPALCCVQYTCGPFHPACALGSAHKGAMGARSVCLQRQDKCLVTSPNRPRRGSSQLTTARLAAVSRTPHATPPEVDLPYLCDSGTTLDKVSRWIGSGPRTTLVGDANAYMKTIIECVKERVLTGARTFRVKVKAHRGEPLNERADTQAGSARQLPPECRQWVMYPFGYTRKK